MKLFCLIILLALANSSASSGYAQIEELTVRGNEAIIEARRYCPREQRLRDGKIHDVYTSVLQTETWVKTAGGWKLKRVENERDQVIEVDGKPANPDGTPKKPN